MHLLMAVEIGETAVNVQLAYADSGGAQAVCSPTPDLLSTSYSPGDELVTLGGGTSITPDDDRALPILPRTLTLGLYADGTVSSVDMSYEVDFRGTGLGLSDVVGTDDPDAICSLLTTFGITCLPCFSDAEPYCMSLRIGEFPMVPVDSSIAVIGEDECHPDCTDCS